MTVTSIAPKGALTIYLAWTGMCRWTGFNFQSLETFSGYTISLRIERLEQGVFIWTRRLLKSTIWLAKSSLVLCFSRSHVLLWFLASNILFPIKTVSKMLVKYVIQCMRNEMNQGHTTRSNRVSEKDEFCRLQWVGRPWTHSITQTSIECPPGQKTLRNPLVL